MWSFLKILFSQAWLTGKRAQNHFLLKMWQHPSEDSHFAWVSQATLAICKVGCNQERGHGSDTQLSQNTKLTKQMQGSRNEKSQEIQLLKERPKTKALSCPRAQQGGRWGGWPGVAGPGRAACCQPTKPQLVLLTFKPEGSQAISRKFSIFTLSYYL